MSASGMAEMEDVALRVGAALDALGIRYLASRERPTISTFSLN